MELPLNVDEFAAVTYDDWKKYAEREWGKKEPPDSAALHDEDLEISAYYTWSNARKMPETHHELHPTWEIRQDVGDSNLTLANQKILSALNGGVEAMGISSPISHARDLDTVLHNVLFDAIPIYFTCVDAPLALAQWYVAKAKQAGIATSTLRGGIQAHLEIKDIGSPENLALIEFAAVHFRHFRVLQVNAADVHQRGGNAIQEIAFALAYGNECLHVLTQKGFSAETVLNGLQFNFAVGGAYFVHIAKLRIFRKLWSAIVEAYNSENAATRPFIHVETSQFLQTIRDPHNNLLRATTQAMSAVLGGADSLTVLPYDRAFEIENETSLRLARNVQHLLREESGFSETLQAADGAYYIESLALDLGKKSWELFTQIEKKGGLIMCGHWFHQLVNDNEKKQREWVEKGQKIIVGENKYRTATTAPLPIEKPFSHRRLSDTDNKK